jgi:hypothetical protein
MDSIIRWIPVNTGRPERDGNAYKVIVEEGTRLGKTDRHERIILK